VTQRELPKAIAAFRGHGYLLAPAGYGKTHLIAESTLHAKGRQLILTHTHAGVNALRTKLRALQVSTTQVHVDTIASWSLRLCLAYGSTSG
jgi:DNA helicase-2/ATP-dependent DNA helicase PcrA